MFPFSGNSVTMFVLGLLFLQVRLVVSSLLSVAVNTCRRGMCMVAILRGSSKVTVKGQITIPQEIREEFTIKPGDTVYFIIEDEKLMLQKGPLKLS